jgi:hypothetical protein
MADEQSRWSARLTGIALSATGLLLLACLPAIWMAWSQRALVILLSVCVAAGAVHCLLAGYYELRYGRPPGADSGQRQRLLNKDVLEELTDIGPYIYQNRFSASPFHKLKMQRIKETLFPRS